jgi:hypothetical protein
MGPVAVGFQGKEGLGEMVKGRRSRRRLLLWVFLVVLAFLLVPPCSVDGSSVQKTGEVAPAGKGSGGSGDPGCAPRPYWQQRVTHRITARLDTRNDDIVGHLSLVYVNNSPDTLPRLYFHLFQNAFRKGSLMDARRRSRGDFSLARLKPEEEGGTRVENVTDGSGMPLGVRVRGTILEVTLLEPLLPGDTARVEMDFVTHYGKVRGRMGKHPTQYQGAQWYPRIAVYDRRRGWNIDEHLGNEFYGEYGTFDVELTVPGPYIVAATGVLQNREEVLPPERRRALDIRWYAPDVDPDERPEIPDPPDTLLTWRFRAENVHDFAWVADSTFRIGETEWDGIKIYSYARAENAEGWQDADSICAAYMEFFSEHVGRYVWPQHSVVDASSGMEYPMLSMDGGRSPHYYGLIGHELAHNWFMGMVGSNETYRAFLDEGFTNFITAWASDSLFGPESSGTFWEGWYAQTFFPKASRLYSRNTRRYLNLINSGYLDPLGLHSDWFGERRSYRQVYYKTSMMLQALRVVLGDEVFERAFRAYFECWKLRHPYPEDFITVMENVSGRQLDWFFDQWLHTDWLLDVAIEGVDGEWVDAPRPGAEASGADPGSGPPRSAERRYRCRVELERKGDMFLPLDLDFTLRDGSTFAAHVPVGWDAKREPGRKVLEPWLGWRDVARRHVAEVLLPDEPVEVRIDAGGRLPDADGRDNRWRRGLWWKLQPFGPVRLKWDNMVLHYESPDAYDVLWRPSLGYTDPSGLWLGLHLRGSYLDEWWTRFDQVRFFPRVGLRNGRFGYELTYDTPVRWLGRLGRWYLKSAVVDGRVWHEVGIRKRMRRHLQQGGETWLSLAVRSRQVLREEELSPAIPWNGRINNSLLLGWGFDARGFAAPTGDVLLETTLGEATPAMTRIQASVAGRLRALGFVVRPRLFAGFVTGERTGLDPWLYRASLPPGMDVFEAYWLRVDGALPGAWWRDGHVVGEEGPALRSFGDLGEQANRVWTARVEVGLDEIVGRMLEPVRLVGLWVRSRLSVWGYYEAGNLALCEAETFRFPHKPLQGAGITVEWRPGWPIPGIPGGVLRLHLPLWRDDPEGRVSSGKEMRWSLGVGQGYSQ